MPRPALAQQRDKFTAQEIEKGAVLPDFWIGRADAPITIVEYSSPTCPHCYSYGADVFPKLAKDFIDAGLVRFAYRDFAINGLDTQVWMLARCAGAKRADVIDRLYSNREKVSNTDLLAHVEDIAAAVGMDRAAAEVCLTNDGLKKKIEAQTDYAYKVLGVEQLPTFFVNGDRYRLTDHKPEDPASWLAPYLPPR
jgi:protein-disulfide isomerase